MAAFLQGGCSQLVLDRIVGCSYVALPSRRKMQDRENCSVAETTFLDSGLNLSLTSVCVGMALAYCFMLMQLVASAFRRPDGDS